MPRIAVVALLLALAGCASTRPAAVPAAKPSPEAFTINGRISVKYDGERSTANLHWKHQSDSDDVLLLAPLGVTVAHIWRDSQGMAMDASGRHYTAQDSSELMQQVLGWHLPLEGLQYWILAQPQPGDESEVRLNPDGQPEQILQDGWVINYMRYAAQSPESLPQLMALQADPWHGPRLGQREGLEIRLVVDDWNGQ